MLMCRAAGSRVPARETLRLRRPSCGCCSARGGHAGAGGAFSVLRFAEPDLPDVVYMEQLTGAVYLDQRSDVEYYLEVVDELSSAALTPAGTTRFIEQVARET